MKQLWMWPLIIATLTVTGLIAGLISEGSGDYLAWVGLGLPVGLAVLFNMRRQ